MQVSRRNLFVRTPGTGHKRMASHRRMEVSRYFLLVWSKKVVPNSANSRSEGPGELLTRSSL